MTRKLEELFDLPRNDENVADSAQTEYSEQTIPDLTTALAGIDKIEEALPAVRGLEASDAEMDELAKKATDSFDDLMDLGMNVDSRYASEIFSVAGAMLGHAITAKTAKLNKKLKMIDLQLRKAKLDKEAAAEGDGPTTTGTGMVLDRNDLLAKLANRDQPKKAD